MYSSGSSLYHLDETTLGLELMSLFYSGADHTLSAAERGMLADMGWTLAAIPEAREVFMLALAACAGRRRGGMRRGRSR